MKISEAIEKRRSVRTFDGTKLREEDARAIMEFAEKAKNPYGIPITWKLLDAGTYGLSSPVIVGTDTFIAGKMRRVPCAEEAFGYSFERIVLFAESIGVGTTWIAGTMNRDAFERAMEIAADEVMPCVSPVGYAAKKMSFRETMMRKGIKANSRSGFEVLFFDGNFETPLTEEKAGALKEALQAVRLAPSAVNKQPWRVVVCGDKAHFYEKQSKGYVSGDGWDIQKIDMGIALCHFELAANECGLDVSLEIAEPELLHGDDTRYIASYVLK
ncbi:MAG: nitroreductase family protein [Clostridia bacterium]|nr:nitroreductase family protein [Clostridia bacterium]